MTEYRSCEEIGREARRRPARHRWRWFLAGAVGLLGPGAFAASASATGSYPGETLSVALNGPAVVGKATQFLATGQQSDVGDYAGGFDLNVFLKDPSVDPTCSPDYWDESNNAMNDPSEVRFVIGDWEGLDTSFSVPFSGVFTTPGPALLCAYSDWITDTAASAQLSFDVASPAPAPSPPVTAPTPPPTPPTTSPSQPPPVLDKPVNRARPRVTRSGNSLRCNKGVWLHTPSGFSYRWMVNGRGIGRAHGSRLSISRSLRGHSVQCAVKAMNTTGATTAVSRRFSVHR